MPATAPTMSASDPEPTAPLPLGDAAAAGETGWKESEPSDGVDIVLPAAALPGGTSADKMPTIGHIGRYALKYKIGEGGLGTVYAAHDPLLSRLIAIKTVNVEMSADERDSFTSLFLNEARAAAGLSHPHIVTVFDAGLADQGAYIAMELLKGRDLRQLRLEGWRPSFTQAATIVRRVADALAYAHSKGVVHRDIKPANIFMVGRTQPRVLDFGIARVTHHHDTVQGESDVIGGSPYYMSPEQVRQEPVDRRGDVFSLGVVLYELLTEKRPFTGNSLAEITGAVTDHRPPTPHELNPSVPQALSVIAMKAIEKDPDDRFRSARALARDLRHWLEEHPQEGETAEEAAPKHRKLLWGGGTVALLSMSALMWWGFGPERLDANASARVLTVAPAASVAAPAASAAPVGVALASATPAPSPPAGRMTPTLSAASLAASEPTGPTRIEVGGAPVIAAGTAPARPTKDAPKDGETPKETPKERRAREAREAREKAAAAKPATASASTGTVRLAVSPWGNVEVDGRAVGTTPPLNELSLSEGRHTITIHNADFSPHTVTVNVTAGQPVSVRHRFGS